MFFNPEALLPSPLSTAGFRLFHNMGRDKSSLEPTTRVPHLPPHCPSLFLSTGEHAAAPTHMVALCLTHRGAKRSTAQEEHTPVLSSLEPWAPSEDYEGQDSAT